MASTSAAALLLMVGCLAVFFSPGGLASTQQPQFPARDEKLPNPMQGRRVKPTDYGDILVCFYALPAVGGCRLNVLWILNGTLKGPHISLNKDCCRGIFNLSPKCKSLMQGENPDFTKLVGEACARGFQPTH